MKVSYQWIKSLVPDLALSPAELASQLTSYIFESKVESERIIDPAVTVVKIVAIDNHPQADRLHLVTVTDGASETRVVCGATNIVVGQVVPFSPVGTKVYDEEGKQFTLKKAKIRGVESPGMLNSPRELGLGDAHGGIYILPDDTPIGSKLVDHIPNDTTLEVDVTPNRAHDCLSHLGIAREIAAILKLSVKEPIKTSLPEPKEGEWQVVIDALNKVWRYIGVELTGLRVAPSPLWLQARLWSVGSRPINNIVDVTNYVMYEIGNPTHTFDSDKLPGKVIGVREGKNEEKLVTLDGAEHAVSSDVLVITSNDTPVAVAGVMGGEASEVSDQTKNIFLEVANFHAYSIYQSSQYLKTITESSIRFAKDLSPAIAEVAAARAIELLQETSGAKVLQVIDYYPRPAHRTPIEFNPRRVASVRGVATDDETIIDALERVRCQIDRTNDTWLVTPPVERLDLLGEHDLVEEVIRLVGLENIPSSDLVNQNEPVALPNKVQWREALRDDLSKQGFTETFNYSFEDESIQKLLSVKPSGDAVEVINPPAPENRFLRQELLFRVLGNVLTNKAEWRKKLSRQEKALFEVGAVFHGGIGGRVEGVVEEERVALAVVGKEAILSMLTQAISKLAERFGLTVSFEVLDDSKSWIEQQQTVLINGHKVGCLGVVRSSVSLTRKVGLPIGVCELSVDTLVALTTTSPNFKAVLTENPAQYVAPSKYPPTYRDVSLIVVSPVTADEVEQIITRVGAELVAQVDLFDEYEVRDDSAGGELRQSLAFHIAYQSNDRTLTEAEVAELHQKIIATLREELQAEVRD